LAVRIFVVTALVALAYWLFLRSLTRDVLYVITRVPIIRCSLVIILLITCRRHWRNAVLYLCTVIISTHYTHIYIYRC